MQQDKPGLQSALQLLRDNKEVSFPVLEQLYWRLPAWIISKQQLFPGSELGNKLSNLCYQLQEFLEGKAIDIEDFYLNLGVPQADLTYQRDSVKHFVDTTTSGSRTLIDMKQAKLASYVVPGMHSSEVRVIPCTHQFIHKGFYRQPIDLLDKFNKMLLLLDTSEQQLFVTAMAEAVSPAVKQEIHNVVLANTRDLDQDTITGHLEDKFDQHPEVWSSMSAATTLLVRQAIKTVRYHRMKDPVMLSLPIASISTKPAMTLHSDPMVAVLNWLSREPPLPALQAIEVVFYPKIVWRVLMEDQEESKSFFRYHGKGAVRAQRDILADPRSHMVYIMVSDETVSHPSGVIYPKYFSMAAGRGWTGYGFDHMARGFTKDGGAANIADESKPVDLEIVQEAQVRHNALISFLSGKAQSTAPPLLMKTLAASKLTETVEWFSIMGGALAKEQGQGPFTCELFSLLGYQYEIARVITSVLSEKRTAFRYRVCFPSGGSHVLAVGTGNSISRMRDVPVAIWTEKPLVDSRVPRSRNRTLSLSSRLLGWWIRLPFVYLSRVSCAVQHNLALPASHVLRDSLDSVVEHTVMHLNTRQQESLMQDQTRYVLAGLFSYEPEREGPLKKVEGVLLHNPSAVVYWARLCRLQSMAFLAKSGMTSDLKLSSSCPPAVVPPQHSTTLSTYGIFVDAMFDSKMFNKDQDYKTASQALDWLGLLKTEVKYRALAERDEYRRLGLSVEASLILQECIQLKSVAPILSDVIKHDSQLIKSATTGWNSRTRQGQDVDFTWNAIALYALSAVYFKGKRLSERKDDYYGIFSDLGDQSLTSFLSSSGSTEKGDATVNRQSVRKSTAMLGFLADALSSENIPYSEVGPWMHKLSHKNPNQYQSLLAAGLCVLNKNGLVRLVSRTETKEQSGGGREFSAMNAVGIVACRLTERVFSSYLPSMPTDRMTDPHAEVTLHNIARNHNSPRKFCVAADNSRFGPNQVMSKSRCIIAMLCLSDSSLAMDSQSSLLLYDLLSESTRLMETKVSKMPHDLFEFLNDQGGLKQVRNHNPDSALGQGAHLMLTALGWEALKPGFEQRWGMYQGALGMLSSCASSMLHDVFAEVLEVSGLAESAVSLVTNDDSAIFVSGIQADISMRAASKAIKRSLAYTLALGGQILNPFKTVVSSHLSEFHSTFSTQMGLISPELKVLVASISAGRGELISDDAKAPVEAGISALRQGVSLFNATSLAIFNTMLHCDQYNRWPALKRHGPRPAALGGPIWIDLTKEIILPGYGDLSLYSPLLSVSSARDVAYLIASSEVSQTENGLLELEQAGTRMVTRRIFKQSRGNKEVVWTHPVVSLPLSGPPALGPLVTSVSSGLLRDHLEQGQDRLLIRMGRNAVNKDYKNLKVAESHWLSKHFGATELSYADIDSVSVSDLTVPSYTPSETSKFTNFVDSFQNWIVAAAEAKRLSPSLRLLLRTGPIKQEEMLVSPFLIREDRRLPSAWSLHTAIRQWGSDDLKLELLENERMSFSAARYTGLIHAESREVTATSMAFSRLAKQRSGPFLAPLPPFPKTSQSEAALFLSKHVFRGLITDAPLLQPIIQAVSESMAPPPELEVPDRETTLWDCLDTIKRGKFPPDTSGYLSPDLLMALLDTHDSGWFTIKGGRVKSRRLGKRIRQYGRTKWKQAYLITVQSDDYKHFVIGPDSPLEMVDFSGWPRYLEAYIPLKLEPLTPVKITNLDTLCFVPKSAFASAAVVADLTGLYLKLPLLTVGLRRLPIKLLDKGVHPSSLPPQYGDWMVWLSGGEIKLSDPQARSTEPITSFEIARITSQFHSQHLMNEWRNGIVREAGNLHNHSLWLESASKFVNYGDPSFPVASAENINWDDLDISDEGTIDNVEDQELDEMDPEEDFKRTLVELGLSRATEVFTESVFLLSGDRMELEDVINQGMQSIFDIFGEEEASLFDT